MPEPDPIADARSTLEMSRAITKPILPHAQAAYRAEMEDAIAGLLDLAGRVQGTGERSAPLLDAIRDAQAESVRILDAIARMIREQSS